MPGFQALEAERSELKFAAFFFKTGLCNTGHTQGNELVSGLGNIPPEPVREGL